MSAFRHPEFPFVKECPPSITRLRRKPRRGGSRKTTEIQRQAIRSKCAKKILLIVETVASTRNIDWKPIFDKERGTNAASAARVLAMGLCCALEIPQYMVARCFKRTWPTVYSAEQRCSKLYRESAKFRREWDALLIACSPTPKKRS